MSIYKAHAAPCTSNFKQLCSLLLGMSRADAAYSATGGKEGLKEIGGLGMWSDTTGSWATRPMAPLGWLPRPCAYSTPAIYIKVLFSFEKISNFVTVTFSFLFNKYCPIIN